MKNLLLAGAAALSLMTTAAMAQTMTRESTSETTTTMPSAGRPISNTVSVTSGRDATPDGDQSAFADTTWRDYNGTVTDIRITNTNYPLSIMMTTEKKTTVTANGVATETRVYSDRYPPSYDDMPAAITTTRTYVVGTN